MCGIVGILNHSASAEIIEGQIQAMQGLVRHRGGDDEGIYYSSDRHTALAHTRLSIIDLSPAGHQPMSSADGRYHITFNGEIYNFRTLRQSLIAQGEVFNSQTDTEVILKLYQREGAAIVDRLRGMFAFAIWDDVEGTCFLARDPLGIKPLYYWQSGSTLVFGSEVRAILAPRLFPVKMSAIGLYGYLTTGSVPEPYTIVEGIHSLPAGHWLKWTVAESKLQQYWQISFGNEPIAEDEAIERVRQALIDSIEHHLISDVPVGIFLSGGIDSTTLVALAHQSQSTELRTYGIAFADVEWNEGAIAQKTAAHFGTQHQEFCVTAADVRTILPKFLAALDRPTIDGFNTFCVSSLASQDGTKVVLSGIGGDEIFGGYKSFTQVPQLVRFSQACQLVKPLLTQVGKGLNHWSDRPPLKRLGEYFQRAPTTRNALAALRGIFTDREATIIAQKYLPDEQIISPLSNIVQNKFPSLLDEISALELTNYLRNQLLGDSDIMSMACGLELRVPFIDRTLLDTISTIPSSLRLAPKKKLLIQSIPELPDWVINQPKRGFLFPFQKWFDRELSDCFPINSNHQSYPPEISLDRWYRRWSLMILDYWWEENK